ncbi:right-handed parallel beta-helix repeat-containing protein [Macrococcoides canis]|uniref:Right-handed parallel beta-helix repeat-containing protein n=1 Tax=Macrococcoides canis TaxID=1855823 RepID=A0A4R6C6S3_9STAP|nr:right-handed parallel beta-helix repeat-containing protein [Macrococcus canis]TDM18140.1 right-handed parallel beta-helix repeat-containing protein [Macrococcus canis]
MEVNSLKTKNNYHNYVVIKQFDNASPIELILCGPDGTHMKNTSGECTVTLLDTVDNQIRQKSNEMVIGGVLTFKVTNALKSNKHNLEVTMKDGSKFPSDSKFDVLVSKTHDETELNIINSMTYDDAVKKLAESVVTDYVDSQFNKLSSEEQQYAEVIIARQGMPNLLERIKKIDKNINEAIGVKVSDFPRIAGEIDDLPRFQRAIDFLEEEINKGVKSGTLIIPNVQEYEFVFKTNSTIQNPTRVSIRKDKISIIGTGMPVIRMTGLTHEYLNSIDDFASSGRDIFSAFSFLGVSDPFIEGVVFIGEHTGNKDFRYQSPRAIAVSFKGCKNIHVNKISGFNILGNVINVVNSNITYDVPFSLSENVYITNVLAENCLENGVNIMGGVKNVFINNLISKGNVNGLESASDGLVLNGSLFIANRSAALALSGKNQVVNGGVFSGSKYLKSDGSIDANKGYGIIVTGGEGVTVTNAIIKDNYSNALMIYPGVSKVSLTNSDIQNNATEAVNKNVIYISGTSTKRIKDITISGNRFDCKGLSNAGIAAYADNVSFFNNEGVMESASAALAMLNSCTGSKVVNNKFNKSVAMADETGEVYNNGMYRTTESKTVPTTGTWNLGDIILNPTPTVGGWVEARCVQGGTFGILNGGGTFASTTAGSNVITVNTNSGLSVGQYINIQNINGVKKIVSINDKTIILDNTVDVTTSSAYLSYRTPIIQISRQNGVMGAVLSAPSFIGQVAVTGGSAPKTYMAVGTSSTSDWQQIGG